MHDALELGRGDRRACRVGRRREQHTARTWAPVRFDIGRAQLKASLGAARHEYRLVLGGRHEMPVARIRRVGHQDFVIAIDERRTSEQQGRGRAGRQDDAAGVDRDAVDAGVVSGNCFAQRCDPQRAGVLRHAAPQGLRGGLDDRLGRREVRLPDAHMDDVAPRAFELRGLLRQLHDVKRGDRVDSRSELDERCGGDGHADARSIRKEGAGQRAARRANCRWRACGARPINGRRGLLALR